MRSPAMVDERHFVEPLGYPIHVSEFTPDAIASSNDAEAVSAEPRQS